jgi:hypothetical protein
MVTPALKAAFEARGVPLIPLEVGARMLADELCGADDGAVELVLGGEPRAEALLAAEGEAARRFDVVVAAGTHPWLADHAVRGAPVVPVALALEWFARAARAARPDLHLAALQDVRVCRGIRLDRFAEGEGFSVLVRQLSNGEGALLGLELRDPRDRVRYTASAEMVERAPQPQPAADPGALPPWEGPIYGGSLFHGPAFQAIRELSGPAGGAMAATLEGVAGAGWKGDWATDPLAADVGLQLAVLFFDRLKGGASLPMSVAGVRVYGDGPLRGPVRCVLRGRAVGDAATVCDLSFVGADGRTVLEMRGVENVRVPGA